MNRLCIAIACLILLVTPTQSIVAQTPSPTAAPAVVLLTTNDIITLHRAGIDDSVLFAKLEQQGTPMMLSIDDLLQLKEADVSDAVVRAMLQPQLPPVTPPLEQPRLIRNLSLERLHSMNPTAATPSFGIDVPPADFNKPLAPHESGIYLDTPASDLSDKMVYIDRITASGGSVNGVFATVFTFGIAPVSIKFDIPNPRATVRTSNTKPVFYFYFEDKPAGLGKTPFAAASASSPIQFQLERFSESKKQRQLLAGKFGLLNGVSVGGKSIPFHIERLRSGIYKVTPELPLQSGEYCFILQDRDKHSNESNDVRPPDIFDFGIDAPAKDMIAQTK